MFRRDTFLGCKSSRDFTNRIFQILNLPDISCDIHFSKKKIKRKKNRDRNKKFETKIFYSFVCNAFFIIQQDIFELIIFYLFLPPFFQTTKVKISIEIFVSFVSFQLMEK